jgi:hypothetical protein
MGNLHLVTGTKGQKHVTSADHASFHAAIFGEGQYVLNRGSKFATTTVTNNQIRVADGDILMQGRHIRLNEGTYVDLTIENGTQGMYRNDLIVARYTKDSATGIEDCNLVVIKGTAVASNPVDPAYTNADIINDHVLLADMPLYRVPLDGLNVQTLVPLFTEASLMADGSVTNPKVANNAITGSKIAKGAICSNTVTFGLTKEAWVLNEFGLYEQTRTVSGYGFSPETHIGLLGHTRGLTHYPGDGNTTWGWSQSLLEGDKEKIACLYSAKLIAVDTIKFVATEVPSSTLYVAIIFIRR